MTTYWETCFDVAGVPETERTAARAAACEAALAPALRCCFPETLAVARGLKEKGVIVGIISNHLVTPPLFDYCAEGAGLRSLVSDPSLLLVSQQEGLGKPDPAIYRLFAERLAALDSAIMPDELLFVDDKAKNVEAAQALGWQGLVFDSRKAAVGDFARECAARGLTA